MRILAAAAATAALLLHPGCDARDLPTANEAPPSATVVVQPGGDACTLDGRRMDEAAVRAELQRLVDGDRSGSALASCRVRVRLSAAPGADWSRVDTLTQYCQSIGINRIELPSAR